MTEELVTLETAKMLKEKGFNEQSTFAYVDEDLRFIVNNKNSYFGCCMWRIFCANTIPCPKMAT